jgi:hypothetical protein
MSNIVHQGLVLCLFALTPLKNLHRRVFILTPFGSFTSNYLSFFSYWDIFIYAFLIYAYFCTLLPPNACHNASGLPQNNPRELDPAYTLFHTNVLRNLFYGSKGV